MLDVHPPEHAAHSWRDFLIHIATIVVGLLIALGLEAAAEHLHNNHLLHTAESNLRVQIADNREVLAADEKQLDGSAQEIATNIQLLAALKNHTPPTGNMDFQWQWNGLQSSAWDTARDTGAIALMPYDTAQGYSLIYGQQALVNQQALVYVHDLYRSGVAMQGRKVSDLEPADIDKMISNSQDALVDLNYLRDLCHSLDTIYKRADAGL